MAAAEGKRFNDPSLWQLKSAGSFTAAEQKCLLKLYVPNSRVLSKNEKEHVDTFRKKLVSQPIIMQAVEVMKNKLSSCQKQLDKFNSPSNLLVAVNESVKNEEADANLLFNEEDLMMICDDVENDLF